MPPRKTVVPREANGQIKKGFTANPYGGPLGLRKMRNRLERIDEETFQKLHTFSKEQLLDIIKRVGGAMWAIGAKTDDEIAEAMRLKMAMGGLNEPQIHKALPAMREWFDRTKGKPTQSVDLTQRIGVVQLVMESVKVNAEQLIAASQGATGPLIEHVVDGDSQGAAGSLPGNEE